MNKKIYILLCFTTLFFNSIHTIAQEKETVRTLESVLMEMQERFGIQFNYASALVDNILVAPPNASLSLKEVVFNLKDQSNLNFVFVSDRIISIKKRKNAICGYLKDRYTEELLAYVTVHNGTKGTITNEDGFFELDLNSESDTLQIRHIGYTPLLNAIPLVTDATPCETIYLTPNQVQLTEIVLSDYLIRGVDQMDNGTIQIDFNKFTILPGLIEKDVLQSVQALPGIQSTDETVSNITIRGGSNDQNLISWDGIKMYQSGHFFGLISLYNPNITQKVTLRKNGSSATETDGVSGTIAMETEGYINPRLKGNISVNLLDGNGFLDTPIGQNASLQVAARKSISNLVETPTYTAYFKRISQDSEIENNSSTITNSNITLDYYDTSLRFLFNPSDKDHLRVNFIHAADEVTFNENATLSGVEEIRKSNLDQRSIASGIQYQRNWNENFNTEIALYETDYHLTGTNANIQENQRFLQKNKVSETGIKLNTQLRVSPQMNLINGYNFVETKVTNLDDVDDPKYVLLEAEVLRAHAVFSEMNFSSKNRSTHLNLGLRFNYLDKFKKQIWEPRLSFNHSFWKHFNVEVLGEFKHQNTLQIINFQNDFLGIEKRRWQLSNNESIPVIKSKQGSMGLSYNQNGWMVNAVSYYKKVTGITTQSQGFHGKYEFSRNSGSYDATGIDLLVRKQVQNMSTWFSYSYLNSTYFFNELPETTFPNNFDITHSLTLGGNYSLHQFLFAAGLNWRNGNPFTQPVANSEVVEGAINYDTQNGDRQDDYVRVDFSSRYEFDWKKNTRLQIGLALWNLLDRDNTITTFYKINTSDQVQKVKESSLGFTPNASIRLIFN